MHGLGYGLPLSRLYLDTSRATSKLRVWTVTAQTPIYTYSGSPALRWRISPYLIPSLKINSSISQHRCRIGQIIRRFTDQCPSLGCQLSHVDQLKYGGHLP